MAATDFTFVQLGRGRIDPAGNTFFGDTKNRTIKENLMWHDELVVMPDPTVPESLGYPTIKQYLTAMASRTGSPSGPHVPVQVAETFIVTRLSGT